LIGGSIALDLREQGHTVRGYDENPIHVQKALDLGLISEGLELEEVSKQSDIVVVAVPVNLTGGIVREILGFISWDTIVIDTGSTKQSICDSVKSHTKRGRYVACHPLAGTEHSGPQAALKGLYQNKKNIICEEHLSDEDAIEITVSLIDALGMQSIFMDPREHDKHMAYVSHLSHVSAFTLGTTVLDIERDQKQIFNLASTGFASTVRLAKSSPHTWSSIFADNSEHLVNALDSYMEQLKKYREALVAKDEEQLKDMISEANEIKRVLNGMKYNIVKLS